MDDDAWTVVAKGSRRKMSSTAFRALQARAETASGPAEDPPDASVDKTWSRIERATREIRDAPFATTLLRRMAVAGFVPNGPAEPGARRAPSPAGHRAEHAKRAEGEDENAETIATTTSLARRPTLRFSRMVILGLGSPTRSAVSRFQLALALVLAEHLAIDAKDVVLYDPAFTPVDVATLRGKGVGGVLTGAEADAACGPGAARAQRATFWFMPHCEAALYENVLRANAPLERGRGGAGAPTSGEKTSRLSDANDDDDADDDDDAADDDASRAFAFCGNRFETYEIRWTGRSGAPECPRRVLEAAAAISRGGVEIEVDPDGTFAAAAALGAFNDTGVQAWWAE